MEYTVLIVEDNAKARQMLVNIVKKINNNICILEAGEIDLAYRYAVQRAVDLFLLDIVLDSSRKGDVSGLTLAKDSRNMKQYRKTPIIFITSLEDPELFSYSQLHCYQYIEKPFDVAKTKEIIEEALGLVERPIENDTICFKKDGILYPMKKSEIIYFLCEKPCTRIVHRNGEFKLSYQPIHGIQVRLGKERFLQCNRGALVNRDFVESIDTVNGVIHIKQKSDVLFLGSVFKKKFVSEMENG